MTRAWIIGSGEGCDLVVEGAGVSGRHCRLTRDGDVYGVEDVGSTNGTFVNGAKIAGFTRVTRNDVITLGRSAPLPWPPEVGGSTRSLRLGREPENDLVVDLPTVSGRHALVGWDGTPGEGWIEDLGSSNGTSVGAPGRVSGRQQVTEADRVYLGSLAVSGAWLLHRVGAVPARELAFAGDALVLGRDPGCDRTIESAQVSGRHARLSRGPDGIRIEDLGSSGGTSVNGRWIDAPTAVRDGDVIGLGPYMMTMRPSAGPPVSSAAATVADRIIAVPPPPGVPAARPGPESSGLAASMAALVAQAAVIALIIVALPGRGEAGAVARSVEAIAVASVWFGLAAFVVLGTTGTDRGDARPGGWPDGADVTRLALIGAAVVAQGVMAWAIASPGAGLRAATAPALGLIALASAVGAALGALIRSACPRRDIALATGLAAVAAMAAIGHARGLAGPAADLMPSRWAFEGLLLLESGARGADAPGRDLAEPYFSAESGRSGAAACATALGFMLAGLAASAAFIARGRPGAGEAAGRTPWRAPAGT